MRHVFGVFFSDRTDFKTLLMCLEYKCNWY